MVSNQETCLIFLTVLKDTILVVKLPGSSDDHGVAESDDHGVAEAFVTSLAI